MLWSGSEVMLEGYVKRAKGRFQEDTSLELETYNFEEMTKES